MRNDKTSFQKLKYVYDNEIIQIYKNITLLTVSAFPLSSVGSVLSKTILQI